MIGPNYAAGLVLLCAVTASLLIQPLRRSIRRRWYTRGSRLQSAAFREDRLSEGHWLWGAHGISPQSCRQHMLVSGTSGSGKSLLLRRTLKEPLRSIGPRTDRRALVYDSENDVIPYLATIGVSCPVYTLNPCDARAEFPTAVRWDVSKDVTNPAQALNLMYKFVPESGSGGNSKFFNDSARILGWAVCNSFNRNSPGEWTYSDLVFALLTADRTIEILKRDSEGREDLAGVFRDAEKMNLTADNVFSTLYSHLAFHRPTAALWQRTERAISIRDWVDDESILIMGHDETMEEAFNLINGMVFCSVVEAMGAQSISNTRETIVWLDELRSCKSILQSGKLNAFLLRMRKRGGIFAGAFQDIEGFRHATGSKELANEIIGQCSHKALARLESPETAQWASELLGQHETIEVFESVHGTIGRRQRSINEQRTLKNNVLPSEFFTIPEPTPETGVEAYFLSPGRSPYRKRIPAREFEDIVVSDPLQREYQIVPRDDTDQTLLPWTEERRRMLAIERTTGQGEITHQGRSPFDQKATGRSTRPVVEKDRLLWDALRGPHAEAPQESVSMGQYARNS